jgi:tRNA nucleotidyltransferase/poly(A) polymerase
MEMFVVGGYVRDEILGVRSKDVDFTVTLDANDPLFQITTDPFMVMRRNLLDMGFKIFLETPEHLTIRAQFPKDNNPFGIRDADFVLARKEGAYSDGRRPDKVEPGTLQDDLARRDFTMNAIAKAADGSYIDPFDGQADIKRGLIRAVGDPAERMHEDALRAVRALRFSVMKGFRIEGDLMKVLLFDETLHDKVAGPSVADDRIRGELERMFAFNTLKSLAVLHEYEGLTYAMLSGSVSLTATMKMKGRGK